MPKKILFSITEEDLETGLRGFPVGYCTTSTVDPVRGLFYSGISLMELVGSAPEEIIYLLIKGKRGSKEALTDFFADFRKRSFIQPETVRAIQSLPRKGDPMKLFSAALLILGMLEKRGDYLEDCLELVAKVFQLAAIVINHHAGWGETPPSLPEKGYIENFVSMLRVPNLSVEPLVEALRLFYLVHCDHGGGNLSTFVGKAVASGLEDMYGSLASAICALAGPRHGKANQDCLELLRSIQKKVGDNPLAAEVEQLLRARYASGQLLFGFGHAILRVEDPRAQLLYQYVEQRYPDHPLAKVALLFRQVGSKILAEEQKISDPHPNVDAISGTLLSLSGFDYPQYFTLLFGCARALGIARQIVYERLEARNGKGTAIVRPRYIYKGPKIE